MRKHDIIQLLQKTQLPSDQYWILAGAALVLHGIRSETADVDIGCTYKLFSRFIEQGLACQVWPDGTRSLQIHPQIEMFEEWSVEQIEQIGGLPVASLSDVKRHKLALSRPKDLDDIRLIDLHPLS